MLGTAASVIATTLGCTEVVQDTSVTASYKFMLYSNDLDQSLSINALKAGAMVGVM